MESTLPGPCETIVSSAHGNTAFSDHASPVTIRRLNQGAIVSPPPGSSVPDLARTEPTQPPVVQGKVHYALPTLRSPEEETVHGTLTGYAIVSTALEIDVSPMSGEWYADDGLEQDLGMEKKPHLPHHGLSKIVRADLYAGRDLLGSWGKGAESQFHTPLPADREFKIHITSIIYGDGDNHFNDNPHGLSVTLTIEFAGEQPGLMISSVALVQSIGSRGRPVRP